MIVLPIVLASTLVFGPEPIVITAPDTLIDVGGHELRIEVREGSRPITIVLEAGGGADASAWATVPDSLALQTGATVVTYDRPGLGGSEVGPVDLTPEEEIRDLSDALDRLGTPAPRILVGHSYGAMLAILHAGLYPSQVVGLVLVDPMNPVFVLETGDFVQSTVPDIAEPANDRERVVVRMKRTFSDLTARTAGFEPALSIPIIVLTAGEPWWDSDEIDRAWRRSHEVIAGRSSDRELMVAKGSDHDVPEERPDLIVDAVNRLLTTVDGGE
ncbi:MAG TPA: alpha/beta hydrolase [Gemmatimonadota bacterium]|nr:alpha/beta hydrolase [Gemmatimonadota bacterium]